jgi:hypothetical protein
MQTIQVTLQKWLQLMLAQFQLLALQSVKKQITYQNLVGSKTKKEQSNLLFFL